MALLFKSVVCQASSVLLLLQFNSLLFLTWSPSVLLILNYGPSILVLIVLVPDRPMLFFHW